MALADDGKTALRNLQLLCGYCNRIKGTTGDNGCRLNMVELRTGNITTPVIVDVALAELTGSDWYESS